MLDWFAAAIPGSVEAPSTLMESVLADDLDRGRARLVGGRAATVRTAALINGTAAHTVEVDDIFKDAIYHPGAPTIAAALAAAQDTQADGARFLRAVAVGYEISTRIGAALGRAHYRYWHNTGTVGTFGAAVAAAALYRLPCDKFAHALATAATFASGLQQAFRMDSMSKPLHAGRAAECGLLAAQMAMAGVTGSVDVLDGEAGMGKAMSDGPDWARAVATLGAEFHITRMTFKNHACCGHTFAPIDAALALKARLGIGADQIRRIAISTYGPALEVAGNPDPSTAAEARFSLPFVVATALIHGNVRLAAFSGTRLQDTEVRALMKRVELNIDPQLDAAFPGQRSARILFELGDGRVEEFVQSHRRGDPELPLTDNELEEKFDELTVPVIGVTSASALKASIWRLDGAEKIFEGGSPGVEKQHVEDGAACFKQDRVPMDDECPCSRGPREWARDRGILGALESDGRRIWNLERLAADTIFCQNSRMLQPPRHGSEKARALAARLGCSVEEFYPLQGRMQPALLGSTAGFSATLKEFGGVWNEEEKVHIFRNWPMLEAALQHVVAERSKQG